MLRNMPRMKCNYYLTHPTNWVESLQKYLIVMD